VVPVIRPGVCKNEQHALRPKSKPGEKWRATKNQAAITDYDRDLGFLKSTDYDGHFSFTWPDW
jgi:hypothetical protein